MAVADELGLRGEELKACIAWKGNPYRSLRITGIQVLVHARDLRSIATHERLPKEG